MKTLKILKTALIKAITVIIVGTLFTFNVFAQEDSLDFGTFDRFGKSYFRDELIKLPRSHGGGHCVAGIFDITFVGNDFGYNINTELPVAEHSDAPQMRNVICQVFNDLSVLIDNSQCGGVDPIINILVSSEGVPSGALAGASSLYTICSPQDNFGIIHGDVSKAINGGVNEPDIYDGIMKVTFNPTGGTWNYVPDLNPTTSQYDLQSIILHEAFHVIGFASLIGANGQSIAPPGFSHHYSRFDTYIRSISDGVNLINWDGCYAADFVLSTGVITSGCNNVVFEGNNTTFPQPIYAPTTGYEDGSSLSHFENNCGGSTNYVMHPSLAPGDYHKVPTDEEVRTLCDIGYETTGNFGDPNGPFGSLSFHTTV